MNSTNKVPLSAKSAYWKCIESKVENERLHHSRFIISPLGIGQANTLGIAMRRASLGELEGTCITSAKFEKITHEYSTVVGIQESVHDTLINLKEIVLRSNSSEIQKAYISIIGPGEVTAQDIILPPSIEIIDPAYHIATLTKKIHLNIELRIERDRGYRRQNIVKSQDGNFPLNAVFMPIRNVNYSIHCFESHDKKIMKEMLLLEIWTNGSITPREAIYEASRSLINLFIPFLHAENGEKIYGMGDINESNALSCSVLPPMSIQVDQMAKEVTFRHIFIDQLELPPRAYNCLKRINVHTISDLLDYSQDDLMKIKNFGIKSVEQVLEALWKRFGISLPGET
nr:RNA polymerase alpha subunit [Isoetes longifolia]